MFKAFTRLVWHFLDRVGLVDEVIDDVVTDMTADAMVDVTLHFAGSRLDDEEFVDAFVSGVMDGIREEGEVPEHLFPRIEARFREEVAKHRRLRAAS